MQVMITSGAMARTRVLQLSPWQIVGCAVLAALALMAVSGLVYHFVLVKAAQANWPVVSQVVGFVVRDEMAQRDRFMRENLDAMAERVGQMQARMVQLEAAGERVSGLVGVKLDEPAAATPTPTTPTTPSTPRKTTAPLTTAPAATPPGPRAAPSPPPEAAPAAKASGQGGPYVPATAGANPPLHPQLAALEAALQALDADAVVQADRFLLIESRLLERRLLSMRVPSSPPVEGPIGSGFGFRADPFTGRAALHTGLDFPADIGTPISAAAGGVVLTQTLHPAYGQLIEIDHGGGLMTRYAHASKVHVRAGDLVKRGQKIAEVGNSGRSTGPHLHFEVLVDGVPQNPARFLGGTGSAEVTEFAQRPGARRRGERSPGE